MRAGVWRPDVLDILVLREIAAASNDTRENRRNIARNRPGRRHRNATAVLVLPAIGIEHFDGNAVSRDRRAVPVQYGHITQELHSRQTEAGDFRVDEV